MEHTKADKLVTATQVWLEEQDLSTQRKVVNKYNYENQYDDYIYYNVEELADVLNGVDLARAVYFGELENWNDYCVLNSYGNVVSWKGAEQEETFCIAQWLVENGMVTFDFMVSALGKTETYYNATSIDEAIGWFLEEELGDPDFEGDVDVGVWIDEVEL